MNSTVILVLKMHIKIVVFFLVVFVSCEVFSKNLDSRHYYDISNGNYENDFVQYDIVLAGDSGIREDFVDLQKPKVDQPIPKKLKVNEKNLCIGSVMMMAMCY